MRKAFERPKTYEPLPEEPIYGNYELDEAEPFMPERYYGGRELTEYPERRTTRRRTLPDYEPEERLPVRQIETGSPVVAEGEETSESPMPFKEKATTPAPTGEGLKLKTGERVVKRWPRPVWFMRMSDVKNVIGHDVHLTRLRSGNYAFRGVDDETFENLYRIVGKRPPSEADTFGPLKIKSKGKKI